LVSFSLSGQYVSPSPGCHSISKIWAHVSGTPASHRLWASRICNAPAKQWVSPPNTGFCA